MLNKGCFMGDRLSSGHKLVFFIVLLGIISVLLAQYISNIASILVAFIYCVGLYLCRPLLMPPGYGATKVRLLSITSAALIAGSDPYRQHRTVN